MAQSEIVGQIRAMKGSSEPASAAKESDQRARAKSGKKRKGMTLERRYTTAAACDLTTHVVRAGGEVVAWCNLYRTGREAQVENVNTLPEWRRRGFARAVVLDAVGSAREAGCELVFLLADRDDWPRDFYERLGFTIIAEQRSFVRVLG